MTAERSIPVAESRTVTVTPAQARPTPTARFASEMRPTVSTRRVQIRAASQVLATLKETGTIASIAKDVPTFQEFFDLLGMPEVQDLEARYGIDEKARVKY